MENKVSKGFTLFITTMSSFITPLLGSSVNVALPTIAKQFSLSAVALGWVSTAYYLSSAVFLVPLGRFADIHGRRKIFLAGAVTYTLTCLFASASVSGQMLILSRVLQGFGSSMIYGTGIAILTSVFPPAERGRVLGINATATYLGLSMGPAYGFLTQNFGWRSIFLVNAMMGFILVVLTLWKLRGEWAEAKGDSFDIPGSVVYGLSLVLMMYGVSLLPKVPGIWMVILGAAGFAAFLWWESRAKSPVFNISLFRGNSQFTFSNLAALVNYSATHGINFLLNLYLQNIKVLLPFTAGLILLTQPVTQAVFSPITGRLSDRVQPRLLAGVGMSVTSIGLVLLTLVSVETPVWLIVANLLLTGFGLAVFAAPNQNAIMGSVDRKFYGIASGALGTMRLTGQVLSMGIVMMSFALYMGNAKITPEQSALLLKSTRVAFGVFAILCFGGIFASLKGGKGQDKRL